MFIWIQDQSYQDRHRLYIRNGGARSVWSDRGAPAPTIGLSDGEMMIIGLALGLRVADLMNLEQHCAVAGNERARQRYAG
jgi:hypothetical protein